MLRLVLTITLGVVLILSAQFILPGTHFSTSSGNPAFSGSFFSQSEHQHLNRSAIQNMKAAEVIKVIDGDTVELKTDEQWLTATLAFIDAPEKEQPFGKEAKHQLSRYLLNKSVLIQPVGEKWIFYRHGENINLNMLQKGYAWPGKSVLNSVKYQGHNQTRRALNEYIHAYEVASENNQGLWALESNLRVPPWQWRKQTVEILPGKEYKFNLTGAFLQKPQNEYHKTQTENVQILQELAKHKAIQEKQQAIERSRTTSSSKAANKPSESNSHEQHH